MKKFISILLSFFLLLSVSIANASEELSIDVGSIITLGEYKQSYNPLHNVEPIEWVVLDYYPEDELCLVLSLRVLDAKSFHNARSYPTWEKSDIRKWLNDDFMTIAFSEEEKNAILTVNISTYDNKGVDGGADTLDAIFLLSSGEVALFLSDDELRTALPTKVATSLGTLSINQETGACDWWLRDPNSSSSTVSVSMYDGMVYNTYCDAIGGVRPAMWIKVDELKNITINNDTWKK